MKDKVFKAYSGLPAWAKGVTAVVIIGGVAYAGYTIYRNHQKKKAFDESNAAGIEAQKELNALLANGAKLSYGNSQYETFSQQLVEAMRGCGTNEAKVYDVFNRMKNKADVLKLISVFGIRIYTPCALSNPISSSLGLFGLAKEAGGSLIAWLNYDLTSAELNKVNSILSSKNIDYSF